jgi:hypothetical protein
MPLNYFMPLGRAVRSCVDDRPNQPPHELCDGRERTVDVLIQRRVADVDGTAGSGQRRNTDGLLIKPRRVGRPVSAGRRTGPTQDHQDGGRCFGSHLKRPAPACPTNPAGPLQDSKPRPGQPPPINGVAVRVAGDGHPRCRAHISIKQDSITRDKPEQRHPRYGGAGGTRL